METEYQKTEQTRSFPLNNSSDPWSENQNGKHTTLPDNLRQTLAKWSAAIADRKEAMRLCPEHSKTYRAEIKTLTGCISDVEKNLTNVAYQPRP